MNRIVDNYRARPFAEGQKPLLFDPGHRILFQSKIQRRRFGRRELAWSIHRARRIDRSIDRSVGDRGARARHDVRFVSSFRRVRLASIRKSLAIGWTRVESSRWILDGRSRDLAPNRRPVRTPRKGTRHLVERKRKEGRKEGRKGPIRFDSIALRAARRRRFAECCGR